MSLWITIVALVVMGVAIDVVYVRWTIAAVTGNALTAALCAAVLVAMSSLGVLLCVKNYVLVMPSALGHALGSYVALRSKQ